MPAAETSSLLDSKPKVLNRFQFLIYGLFFFGVSCQALPLVVVLLPYKIAQITSAKTESAWLGLTFLISNIVLVLIAPVWGFLSDRLRRRRPFMFGGPLLAALSTIGVMYARNPTEIILAYTCMCFFFIAGMPAAQAMAADLDERGKLTSYGSSCGQLGSIVGALIILFVDMPPQQLNFILAGILALCGAITSLCLPEFAPKTPPANTLLHLKQFLGTFRSKWFMLLLLAVFVQGSAETLYNLNLEYFIGKKYDNFNIGKLRIPNAERASSALLVLWSVGCFVGAISMFGVASRRKAR